MQPPEKMALEGPLKENNLLEKAEVLSTEVDTCTINEFKVGGTVTNNVRQPIFYLISGFT